MKAFWRWALLIGGGLVAAALIAAGLLAYLVSRLDVRAEVERAVENATGRQMRIEGDVGVSYWPVLGLRAETITLANVAGGRAPAFIAADEIHVGVQIRPLFDRQVAVERLVLDRPQIALEVDAQGQPNWVLAPPRPAGEGPARPPSEPAIDFSRTTLRGVSINDGEVSFFDARRGAGWVVGDVDIRTSLESFEQPMQVRGSLRYADVRVRLDMEITRPGAMRRGELTPLKVDIDSDLLTAEFQGQTLASSGEVAGNIRASGPSLRRLAAWMGSPIQGAVGLEQFAVSGRVQVSGGASSFTNAGFAVDRVSGRGDFVLSERGGKPYLSGRLEVFDFDLNPYLTGQAPPRAPAAEVAAAAEAPAPSAAQPSAEIAASEAAPRVLDVQAAPSETPISFAGLRAFNADIDLTTAAVLVQRMRIDNSRASLVFNDGLLAATVHNMGLYGGTGSGRFEIDARQPDTRIVQDFAFSGLDARRFLTAAINYSNIEGRAEMALNVRTRGRTQSELINNLDGSTHFEVVSGTLHGVDLGGVSTTIRNALRGELIAPEATTRFQGLSATFLISDGVMAADDISFNTADLRIPGIGVIDLPRRRLDLRLAPRSPRGGIVFPFAIRGPWSQLGYNADISDRAQREILARVRQVEAASRASNPNR
jgi:AsmA protein